ncbi:MAG: alpha/beta hydrolase [Burkholderiales bacterium]|nr:alpha/beta hydrolase [Burkholderiales bacterium]
MYQARRTPRSEFVPIRTLKYHVWVWGEPRPGVAPLVMVHGWMDIGASFQFVVDEFAQDHYVIAPDWRGYGLTETPDTDNYWFPDYLADLDFLLDHYAGDAPVDLVGHSMGGNVAMLYAGARPSRVRKLVNLEGFGMPATKPSQAPGRYAKWMDALKDYHRGGLAMKAYDSPEGVVGRLMKTNHRLTRDKAEWLAQHWSRQEADGRWHILGHEAHKIINANIYRVDEVLELYKAITAPTLCVEASHDSLQGWWQGRFTLAEYHERLKSVADLRRTIIDNAAHMLHHDQPAELARLIEDFVRDS